MFWIILIIIIFAYLDYPYNKNYGKNKETNV